MVAGGRVPVHYGVSVPNFGEYGDARRLAELAREAEDAGWDGFFIWDHVAFSGKSPAPLADTWTALTAIAMRTTSIRLGPLVTPVPRRRPWVLARQAVTLDHLSGGRLTLGVGIGYPPRSEFERFGEDADAKVRAQKLDEGLAILDGLWSGEPFSFEGQHYRLQETIFLPRPVQAPRIPIWVAGHWPNKPPFRRAARWDGIFPESVAAGWEQTMPIEDVQEAMGYIRAHRAADTPFDLVIGADTTGTDHERDRDHLAPYIEAGLTWWVENLRPTRGTLEQMRARLRLGPPA
jgi:alkanesulfonate monooxygenase SsuD/methylene tetrahydromethanopterin reductase-like flavin-dependent oxidoreductase (luciferase family)